MSATILISTGCGCISDFFARADSAIAMPIDRPILRRHRRHDRFARLCAGRVGT